MLGTIGYYLLCSIFVITAYKNTRYAHTYYMIKKYTIYISTILEIDTLIFPAIILKIVSFHVLSLTDTWVGHW